MRLSMIKKLSVASHDPFDSDSQYIACLNGLQRTAKGSWFEPCQLGSVRR